MPPSTSPSGPSPGQSQRSGPRHLELGQLFLPLLSLALVLAQQALPWTEPAPLHSAQVSPIWQDKLIPATDIY